jgi:hypothetical protein
MLFMPPLLSMRKKQLITTTTSMTMRNGGILQHTQHAKAETDKRQDCSKVIRGLVIPRQRTVNDQIDHSKDTHDADRGF